jgi:hypothetical protein
MPSHFSSSLFPDRPAVTRIGLPCANEPRTLTATGLTRGMMRAPDPVRVTPRRLAAPLCARCAAPSSSASWQPSELPARKSGARRGHPVRDSEIHAVLCAAIPPKSNFDNPGACRGGYGAANLGISRNLAPRRRRVGGTDTARGASAVRLRSNVTHENVLARLILPLMVRAWRGRNAH